MLTFQDALSMTSELEFPIGETEDGSLIKADLSKINHLFVSGISGSGKSVFIDTILLSLLTHNSPEELRLILCDTKAVGFLPFNRLPHLYVPVCTDERKIAGALQWAHVECLKRLRTFSDHRVKDIDSYNTSMEGTDNPLIPRIAIFVDDLSGPLSISGDASDSIKQILSKGRIAGIHLIAITQTPTLKPVKEIAPLFYSKIVFQHSSAADYRFLTGAKISPLFEGPGDALYCSGARREKIHTIKTEREDFMSIIDPLHDISIVCGKTEAQVKLFMDKAGEAYPVPQSSAKDGDDDLGDYDPMLPQAVETVLEMGYCSTSSLQRRMKLAYSRAARIVDQLEELGIVAPYEGAKPRAVIIDRLGWHDIQMHLGLNFERL